MVFMVLGNVERVFFLTKNSVCDNHEMYNNEHAETGTCSGSSDAFRRQ